MARKPKRKREIVLGDQPWKKEDYLPERPLRFLPLGGGLVEVTTRTVHGRLLLKPTPECKEIIEGVLGRALWKNPRIGLVGYSFLSNHGTLLLTTPDEQALSAFMDHLNSNLARELGRLFDWPEHFWGRRYRAIYVGTGRWVQVDRMKYLLSQGCKEGLVACAADWPGAFSVQALTTGIVEKGIWFDRTAEFRARRRGKNPGRYTHSIEYPLVHVPLPCWANFTPAERQARARELVAEVEAEAAERNKKLGRRPMGRKKILEQDPHSKPMQSDRSPAPLSHGNALEREDFKKLYWAFVKAYRAASARLRSGILPALCEFPPRSFFPRIPSTVVLLFESPPPLERTLAH